MKKRINKPWVHNYSSYGGRGITYCKEWEIFANFFADMGECPPGLTLERVNVDGNYEPSNCIWASLEHQANNRRNNIRIAYNGKIQTAAQWSRELGISSHVVRLRDRKGLPLRDESP
jgi:hypothetical protein